MKRYFAYTRVSTAKQGERGSSLQEQRSAIESFAIRNRLHVVAWFEERETAAKEGRYTFSRMLIELSRGGADGIIIHKIDRGARNLRDWANLGDLIDRGVDVQFVHDNLDLQSRGGRLSADIQAVVAADYVRNLRDEVRKGFYGRLKQGIYPLPAPLGYLDRGRGNPKAIDPIMGPLVRQGFELYAQNRLNLIDLRAELTRRGLRSRNQKAITVGGLAKLLHNPFYVGVIHIERTNETFAGIHEPLVEKVLFDRVQAVLKGKHHCKLIAHDFIFRRTLRCGACTHYLVGERKKGRYVYYRCYNRECRREVIREQDAKAAFEDLLNLIRLTDDEIGDLKGIAAERLKNVGADIAVRQKSLELQLAKGEERLNRLTDALLDGLISKDVFEARKHKLLLELRGLRDTLSDPRTQRSPAEEALRCLELRYIKESGREEMLPSELRDFAEAVVWNFSVQGKKPTITLKSPYQEIANWRKTHASGPHRITFGTELRNLLDILTAVAKRAGSDTVTEDASHDEAMVA